MAAGLFGLVFLIGCEPDQLSPAPKSLAEYDRMGKADRRRYPDNFVVQYNLARVHNTELSVADRTASLAVVDKLGVDDETSLADLATLLRDPKCPPDLSKQVLRLLLKQNYSDLAAHVLPLLSELKNDPQLRDVVVNWMKNNAPPQMLAGLVRTWAAEPNLKSSSEQGYRDAVQQISGRPWNATLLESLNSPEFAAKGEAYEILRKRENLKNLRDQIRAMSSQTDVIAALQNFIDSFEYMPQTGEQLNTCALIYRVRRDMLPDAAKLFFEWNKSYKYNFEIRDFHLLSRLARDPLRTNLKRTQLVLDIGQSLRTRRHVRSSTGQGKSDNFWLQVDKLSMADLWNIYLIDEMLSRPRVQTSLKLMADGDLADTRGAWGGLVFYQNGQAEAILYPPDPQSAGSDLTYQPTLRLTTDGRDSLCRFIGHFEKIENENRAGPTEQELKEAAGQDFYGLILTRISKNSFSAHYFNPDGVVVSLGKFQLR